MSLVKDWTMKRIISNLFMPFNSKGLLHVHTEGLQYQVLPETDY